MSFQKFAIVVIANILGLAISTPSLFANEAQSEGCNLVNVQAQSVTFIVKFKLNVTDVEKNRLHDNLRTEMVSQLRRSNIHVVETQYVNSASEILKAYEQSPLVETVELNQIIKLPVIPGSKNTDDTEKND